MSHEDGTKSFSIPDLTRIREEEILNIEILVATLR